MPIISAVGTATPPYKIAQADSRDFTLQLFGEDFKDIDRLLNVFASAQIESRYFCVPLEWFRTSHSFEDKNKLYIEHALRLSAEAIHNCLAKAGLTPQDIDHLVFVSSTGLATPSMDAYLFNLLKMRTDVKRTPIWGLGCAGGVTGLARGFDLAQADPNSRVMVVCTELCGLTFLHQDRSKSNLIATSLFADGAAAVLLTGDERAKKTGATGPTVLGTRSMIWSDTLGVMGWEVKNEGLEVVFSKNIPTLVMTKIRPVIEAFVAEWGLTPRDLNRLVAHPGGTKVLVAYEEALSLAPDILRHARAVLNERGNMSSCTVLYVLERELEEAHEAGEHGLVLSLGPGFACEQVMIRW